MKKNLFLVVISTIILFICVFFIGINFYTDIKQGEYNKRVYELQVLTNMDLVNLQNEFNYYNDISNLIVDFLRDNHNFNNANELRMDIINCNYDVDFIDIVSPYGYSLVYNHDYNEFELFNNIKRINKISYSVEKDKNNNKNYLNIMNPIYDYWNQLKGYLLVSVDIEDLLAIYDNNSIKRNIQIIDKNGNYIARCNSDIILDGDTTALEGLKLAKTNVPYDEIIECIKQNKSMLVEVEYNNKEFFSVFTPFNQFDWYIVENLEKDLVDNSIEIFLKTYLAPVAFQVLFVLLAFNITIIAIIFFKKDKEVVIENRLTNQLIGFKGGFLVVDLNENKIVKRSKDDPIRFTNVYSEVLNTWINTKLIPEYHDKVYNELSVDRLLLNYQEGIISKVIEYPHHNNSNEIVWSECEVNLKLDNNSDHILAYCVYRNIDALKRKEISLENTVNRDFLTNLYNRRGLELELMNILSNYHEEEIHALVMLDFDNFKDVNDLLGHNEGDEVLKRASAILKAHFRQTDIVARLGGDEFVILINNINKEQTTKLLNNLNEKLHFDYVNNEMEIHVTASMGVYMITNDKESYQSMLKKADEAMYEAKTSGKNKFVFYDNA